MISIELKAKFRRATREIDENAVARQISVVFDDSLREIEFFHENFTKFTDFDDISRALSPFSQIL